MSSLWQPQIIDLSFPSLDFDAPIQYLQLSVFVIPTGTTLYRGRTDRQSRHSVPSTPTWFATDQETANIYGYIDVYTVVRPIVLLNLSNLSTHRVSSAMYDVWAESEQKNKYGFREAYPLSKNNRQVLRDSTFDADTLVSDWFINAHNHTFHPLAHLDGFGTGKMNTTGLSFHHPEMMVVEPDQHLVYVGTLERQYTEEEESKIAYNRIQRQAPKKSRRQGNGIGSRTGTKLAFGDD